MSGWKDDDEVTTTYGSIQLSLEQAHAAGIKTERERIIKLLNEMQEVANLNENAVWVLENAKALIKGENK